MKAHMFLLRGAMIVLLAGSAAVSLGAGTTYTWNQATSGDWTNSANWLPSTGFPTNSDTAIFTNTALGTCTISSNVTVGTLQVSATNNAAFAITINTGYTLIPKAWYQGYNTNQTNSVTITGGGTFAPSGAVYVAYAASGSAVAPSNNLTLSGVTWDSSGMNGLYIGNIAGIGYSIGTLTATNATFMYKGLTNTLGSLSAIQLGNCTYAAAPTRSATGFLYLSGSVTNIIAGQLLLGGLESTALGNSVIGFGSNPIMITATNGITLGGGSLQTVSGTTTSNTVPMGSTLTVNSLTAPGAAGSVQIGWATAGLPTFGRGFTNVAIYCGTYTVGGAGAVNAQNNATNDFRDATKLAIVATNSLKIGVINGDNASMYLPANSSVACSNVVMGVNSGTYASWDHGVLNMSNTTIAVSNSVTLNSTAIVTNYINGSSSGFDIGTTSFTVVGTNGAAAWAGRYGQITLVFVSDPINPTKPYWGLRLKGDARSWLPNLTNAPTATTLANNGYLSWSTAGLSASARSRFGIQYDGVYTYVGVSPTSGGMTMFFW